MSWTTSTIGDVLNVIQNGINCKQAKDGVGDKISRIETISDASVNFNKVGYAVLTESEKHKGKLHKNDILFSHINSPIHVGKSALYAEEETLYHGINLLRLRVNDNIDSRFFNYFLNRLFWSGYWKRTAKQSVNQASVNQTDIKVVPFSYPPIPEQQRIVAILDQAFADIEKARANAEKNLKNARELFDSYLNQVFSQRGEGWVEHKLVEVVDVIDSLHKTPKYSDTGYPMVRVTDIKPGALDLSKTRKVCKATYEEFSKRYKARIGDIVFSRVGSYGKSSIVTSNEPFCLGQNTVFLAPSMNGYYFYYFLNSPRAKEQIDNLVAGTTQPTVSLKSLKSLNIPIPVAQMQLKIVTNLNHFSDEIDNLESIYKNKLSTLDELKKSLLQKAFSGELTKTEGHAA